MQSGKVIDGGRRLRCGGKDRLLVGLQHGEPRRQILRMIGAWFVRDAEIGAEKRGSQFRNKFLAGVALISEAFRAEIAFKTALVLRPVRQLTLDNRTLRPLRPVRSSSGSGFCSEIEAGLPFARTIAT